MLAVVWAIIVMAAVLPWPHPGRISAGSPCKIRWWDAGHEMVAYVWAVHLENTWQRAQPRTRAELERSLSLYTVREIRPSESCWGSRREPASDEKMMQYLILWHAPLDVVYDGSDRIRMIYASYE
jgi:hypothetical protein